MVAYDKAAEGQGHIYVILFSNGVVKVGQTHNWTARLQAHRAAGRSFGLTILETWVSLPHVEYQLSERKLIRVAIEMGGIANSAEYFTGLDFLRLASKAQALTPGLGQRRPGPDLAAMTRRDWDAVAAHARAEADEAKEYAAALLRAYHQVMPYLAANPDLRTKDVAHLIRPDGTEPPPSSAPPAAQPVADRGVVADLRKAS